MDKALHFLLFCDIQNSRFTLRAEGEDWSLSFEAWDDVYEEAIRRAKEETPLTVFNELGKEIVKGTVSPSWGKSSYS